MKQITFCLACGAETPSGRKCAHCGAPLHKEAPAKAPRLLRRPAFLYYALCVLAAVAAIVALLLTL